MGKRILRYNEKSYEEARKIRVFANSFIHIVDSNHITGHRDATTKKDRFPSVLLHISTRRRLQQTLVVSKKFILIS